MNNLYLEKAKKVISNPKILSIIAAKRANQLAMGGRPMVKCDSENPLDVAMLEIAENKIGYEFGNPETAEDVKVFAAETEETASADVTDDDVKPGRKK